MRKLFINLFMFSLTLNSFAYFNENLIRLFTKIREDIYWSFHEKKIVSKKDLYKFFKNFKKETRKKSLPLKDIEYNVFVAHILCYIYEKKIFLKNFSEEELIKELKKYMTEAIKGGSEDVLLDLYRITKTSLAVCISAMLFLLTNTSQDYIFLCRTCKNYFEVQYKEVVKYILGRDDIVILLDYPEGIGVTPSTVNFEINTDNLDCLKKVLNDMCKDDIFYEVLALSLESWYKQCKN